MANLEHFLVIHNDYLATSMGLFAGEQCIDRVACDNKKASKMIFVLIDEMLQRNNCSLSQLAFIGVNQGPGPFTTLRVSIAAANGLGFATKLPLVGINSIETFVNECRDEKANYTIALSNAFCSDLYYAITDPQGRYLTSGCIKNTELVALVQNLNLDESADHTFKLIGNYAEKGKKLLESLNPKIYLPQPCPVAASLEAMGKQAHQQWLTHTHVVSQLLPLYLKSLAPEMV